MSAFVLYLEFQHFLFHIKACALEHGKGRSRDRFDISTDSISMASVAIVDLHKD